MQRCSVGDTSVCSLRLYLRANLVVERCHIAYSMSGILAQDRSTLELSMSRIEKMWFGAAVAAVGQATIRISRCDLRQSSFGLILQDASAVNMSYSAVINCTYAAFHQVEEEAGGEQHALTGNKQLGNQCCLNLTGNSIYSSLSRMAWWDTGRPSVLEQDKNMFQDAQPSLSLGLL